MSDETPWVIKGVSERTRQRVKAYAADRGLTMAEAVERIVNMALGVEHPEPPTDATVIASLLARADAMPSLPKEDAPDLADMIRKIISEELDKRGG